MIDLHLHSTASDGTLTPSQVVMLAKQSGLTAVALTDHDTVAGLDVAFKICQEQQINFVPGIELSTKRQGHNLHILGYFINWREQKLSRILVDLKKSRQERAAKIVAKLNTLGISLSLAEVKAISGKSAIGRPHIALALVQKKLVKDVKTAFELYLANGKPAHVEKKVLEEAKVIKLIHELKGLAVLAHPGLIKVTPKELTKIVAALVNNGLDGLEVYHPEHSFEQQIFLQELAERFQLVITGGSDCHGIAKAAGINIGSLKVPDEIYVKLKQRHSSQFKLL